MHPGKAKYQVALPSTQLRRGNALIFALEPTKSAGQLRRIPSKSIFMCRSSIFPRFTALVLLQHSKRRRYPPAPPCPDLNLTGALDRAAPTALPKERGICLAHRGCQMRMSASDRPGVPGAQQTPLDEASGRMTQGCVAQDEELVRYHVTRED